MRVYKKRKKKRLKKTKEIKVKKVVLPEKELSPKFVVAVIFTHKELLDALYWAWEGFSRAAINFFVVYDTASSIINNKELKGERVDIGVRLLEWKTRSRDILEIFLGKPEKETDTYCLYKYKNIPVVIHIYEDVECIKSFNTILYENEYFNLPNSVDTFSSLYGESWTLEPSSLE